jgi:hypothetical protein
MPLPFTRIRITAILSPRENAAAFPPDIAPAKLLIIIPTSHPTSHEPKKCKLLEFSG